MINANDLMLGNWILDHEGKPTQVFLLRPSMYGNCVPGATEEQSWNINLGMADQHSPIPLTPELMEKIGWVKTIDSMQRKEFSRTGKKGDFNVVHFNYGKYNFEKPKECIYNVRRIKYLHELQNMYRWETGKPLEVTLQ